MKFTISRHLLALVFYFPAVALAQLPSAELYSLYPPVIRAGETTEVTVAGLHLEDLTALYFSDPRLKAEPVSGTKQFRVTAPADITDGLVEVRVDGYFGRSTSRLLTVCSAAQAVLADAGAIHHKRETAPELPLETLAYGRTEASRVDYWKFTLTKGQRILIHCQAERIDSRADATLILVDSKNYELESSRDAIGRDPMIDFTAPESGSYFVGVHDFLYNGGDEYPYLLTVSARPWIDAVYPPAGQEGQVFEATLLGRNLPGGSPGEGLTIEGKPVETLPARITVGPDTSGKSPPGVAPARAMIPTFEYRHEGSNPVRIGIAKNPVISEVSGAELPPLTVPCEVAARFDTPGDSDGFRFSARAGTAYWIEVIGDRLSGRVDPSLVLEKITKDAKGMEVLTIVKEGDDIAPKAGPRFNSGTRDTSINLAAGEAADYRVTVINQYANGDSGQLYRLAIREAHPDFQIIAVTERPYLDAQQAYPFAPFLRKGGTAPLRILIDRKGGFDGPVTLEAAGLPPGVVCPPVTATAKEDSVRLVMQANADAAGWNGTITVKGRAKVGDQEVVREARSGALVQGAADMTKEKLRSRLCFEIPLAVSATEKEPLSWEVGNGGRFTVEMGKNLEIPFKITARNGVKGPLVITLDGLNGLKTSPTVNLADNLQEGKLALSFTTQNGIFTPEVGTWTFVLKATGAASYRYRPEAADRAAAAQKAAAEAFTKATAADQAAKAAAAKAKTTLDAATAVLAKATPEAKPALEAASVKAKTDFDAATKASAGSAAALAAATKEKTDSEARAKAAATLATAKDLKFTTFSLPVTVEVKAPPEAPKKTS